MDAPELQDEVIELRPLTHDDAAAHLAGEDDEIVRWLGDGEASTEATVTAWIERNLRAWERGGPVYAFGIFERATGSLVGHVDANTSDNDGVPIGEANVSYSLHPSARGRGCATRSVELLCEFLRDIGIGGAVIRADPGNAASLAVAERTGFVRGGTITTRDGDVLVVLRRPLGG